MTLWIYLALFLFGIGLFEFGSKLVVGLENKGVYDENPFHTIFVWTATSGLTLSVCSILKIVRITEEDVKLTLLACDNYTESRKQEDEKQQWD